MLNSDSNQNISFKSNFIHSTLKKIQRIQANEIIEVAQSTSFIFYCIFAILILLLFLSFCFCPTILLNLVKFLITSLIIFNLCGRTNHRLCKYFH